MIITDYRSFVEFVKDILPFAVCIITFIAALVLYKVVLKTDRRNPLIYILSGISVIGLYFSAIKIFGLQRTDYFLDGFNFFMKQCEGIITQALIICVSIFAILKCLDLPLIVILFNIFVVFLRTVKLYSGYITLTLKMICVSFVIELKNIIHHFTFFINKYFVFENITRSLMCVFNC